MRLRECMEIPIPSCRLPPPKNCLLLALLAQDIVSKEVELQFSLCPVVVGSLVSKLGLLELLNLFCI